MICNQLITVISGKSKSMTERILTHKKKKKKKK